MVVMKYRPKGKGPPPCPTASQLAFTDDHTSEYIWGRSVFGRVAANQSTLPRLAAEFFDKNLVGKDVAPRVGMTVVHTLKPSYGAGKVSPRATTTDRTLESEAPFAGLQITRVMEVPNDTLHLPGMTR